MATSKDIISGVGARYGQVFVLDSNGLPYQATANTTMETGKQFEGIKTLSATTPAPQRINHYGDDTAYAQDSLAPTEIESFNITTSKVNLTLDAYLEASKVKNIGAMEFRVGDSDNRGNEPLVCAMFYRQALDTVKGSATFGKLRQWHGRIYPSCRISPQAQSLEQGATDTTYVATPTKVTVTPWGETFDGATSWGATKGAHIEFTVNNQPRLAVGVGNGTITSWALPAAPVAAADLLVWVSGTLTSPGSITYGASPAFTVTPAAAVGAQVFAVVGASAPS